MLLNSRVSALSRHLTSSAASSTLSGKAPNAPRKVCLIVGAGDATGTALAKRFHQDGYFVACARRAGGKLDDGVVKELGGDRIKGYSVDARIEEQVAGLFAQVEQDMGNIDVCIHNIGGNVRFSVLETTERVYRKVWELCGLSAFIVGREAARYMTKRGKGTIIFTGATASTRGAANFAAFSGGMSAKRSLAQTMARELGPLGVHVAHVVIDGPIQTEFVKGLTGEAEFAKKKANDELLSPPEIAEAYIGIVNQHRSAWTFEMDLRPYSEKF